MGIRAAHHFLYWRWLGGNCDAYRSELQLQRRRSEGITFAQNRTHVAQRTTLFASPQLFMV